MASLGRARKPELIKRTLELTLGGDVKEQDIYLPLSGLRTHRAGVEALWTWMKENWDELKKRLPPGLSMLSSVVTICTSSFTHAEHIADIRAFFADRTTKGFDQSLAQSLDAIKAKENWIERDSQDVKDWLSKRG